MRGQPFGVAGDAVAVGRRERGQGGAVRGQVIDQQASALGLQTQCWFRLDRWDEVLATEDRWRDLERRYNRERVGET